MRDRWFSQENRHNPLDRDPWPTFVEKVDSYELK